MGDISEGVFTPSEAITANYETSGPNFFSQELFGKDLVRKMFRGFFSSPPPNLISETNSITLARVSVSFSVACVNLLSQRTSFL